MSYLRTIIKKAGTLVGVRRRLNFIEGTNVTLTIADDSVNDEVDITITAAGGSGSPGGLDTHVQFNDGGVFGGEAAFTYDKTAVKLSVNGEDTMTVNAAIIDAHLAVHGADGLTEVEIEMHRHGNTASAGAAIYGARSRGSVGSQTIVQNGDALLNYTAVGYDGTDYATSSQIQFEVDGTPGANDMPGRIVFNTSPDGSQTLTERMRIDSAGAVNISGLTASELISTNANKNLQSLPVATYPSLTELSYVKGVTSAIQTQLDNKLDDTQFSGVAKISVGTTTPVGPAVGDLWVDTN